MPRQPGRDPQPFSEWPAGAHHAFVTRLLQRSRGLGALASRLHDKLEDALAARGETIEDAIRAEGQHEAAQQASVANLIGSLRLIGTFDWSEFFESVSLVEQVLQRDPAAVYARMDFRSRDRYRHAVEELAAPTGEGQFLLALKAVECARQVAREGARRARIARRLPPHWRRAPRVRAARGLAPQSRTADPAGIFCVGHAALSRLDRGRHGGDGRRRRGLRRDATAGLARRCSLVALLTLVPASEVVIQLLQRVISYLIPPRRLPGSSSTRCRRRREPW